MNKITFFNATTKDVQTLVENRIAFAQELAGIQPKEKIEALRSQLNRYFLNATSDDSCISIIALCDNKTAGIGSVHLREMPGGLKNPSGKWGYIMNMYTLPNFRRQGICKGILIALIEEAKKCGTTAFELHATKEGEFVYKQNGFLIHVEPTYRKFIME